MRILSLGSSEEDSASWLTVNMDWKTLELLEKMEFLEVTKLYTSIGPLYALKSLLKVNEFDARSVTGKNLRRFMLKSKVRNIQKLKRILDLPTK